MLADARTGISQHLFADILRLIAELRPQPESRRPDFQPKSPLFRKSAPS
jgi:hypothetical protein